ncbi:hypothetical protein M409DRAFT_23607 [Zasmidium cellare ATCC 36951]|uniref:Uncharacterized protein n=1 Tax=Zasmidium cellare ATCC 36951 TaxID=1080233 RepID=A0A6A6CFG6_ZASCE|nr:uncharacterized protein M409DRAFT_23607 [Zasmidium cellare ATCC 36951]KAF2165875.1 hypothetical protein M409DRAFT_23607 [Zasmidium cellare ATCC 36951]
MAPRRRANTTATAREPARRSARLVAAAARASGAPRRSTIRINPAAEARRRAAAEAAAAAIEASPEPEDIPAAPESTPPPEGSPSLGSPTPPAEDTNFLAYTTSYRTIQYGPRGEREERRLKCMLVVARPPPHVESRLRYYASFFLDGENGSEDGPKVAVMSSYRIDKRTTNAPNAKASWIDDYLTVPDPNALSADSRELAKLLRSVFKVDGVAKHSIRALRNQMNRRGVMVIDVVNVFPAFQGRGLMRTILQMFRAALQELPEWFVFRDVLILNNARFTGEMGDTWGEMTDDAVANTLRNMYERMDNYQWCGNQTAWGEMMGIMARMVQDA